MYFDIRLDDQKHRIEILHGIEADWDDAMSMVWRTFQKYDAGQYPAKGCDSFLNFISDSFLKRMFVAGRYRLFVAKDGEKIVGVATLRESNHISLLFVDGRYQGKGIGRALVEVMWGYVGHTEDEVYLPENEDEKICDVLYGWDEDGHLSVYSAPSAAKFYEKAGFVRAGDIIQNDGIVYLPYVRWRD